MIEGLIGKKIGMTQTYDKEGNAVPATVILTGPCTVIQKKTLKKDDTNSVQLGFYDKYASKKITKPSAGHFKKADAPPTKILSEFNSQKDSEVKPGDQFFVDIFEEGEKVDVIGISKGKGFSGVIKRWKFHGGKKTHGSMFHRHAGSIGCSADPSRVMKGKKMPGHSGNSRVTIRNLTVLQAKKEENLLLVKGSIPGANGGYVTIKKVGFQKKSKKIEKKG
ncbi:MAG: 50S ribosomal protein L3 [Acidobacteriota bacterium]